MSEHGVTVRWDRNNADFLAGRYSREHSWHFDGGAVVAASASPSNVPAPFSNPANVDPEEAFVAALSSCHMLWFLYLAGSAGFQIDHYEDHASGRMTPNGKGAKWVSHVTLRPRVDWTGAKRPAPEEVARLHHEAHERCFIANSVKSDVRVEPQ